MCGIAGWAERNMPTRPEADLITMCDTLRHRGPDGAGTRRIEAAGGVSVGLGHRRLAIIDLAGGAQPMDDPRGRGSLVFNGEIYNFRELRAEFRDLGFEFRTESDTEVLLNACIAWGPAANRRLRGMFAYAFWDAPARRLLLARDPFGKKPLYLARSGENLYFASEIKALTALGVAERRLDPDALWHYMQYRYVPGPRTMFAGVEKLPPGHGAVWCDGRLAVERYFRPPDGEAAVARTPPADPPAAFAEAFDEAVRIRMVSDVPYGAFLSGGIDSTAVVAHMARHAPGRVKTFSVGFAESAYSELGYAEQVARAFGTEHWSITFAADRIPTELPRLVIARDAPVAEPSDIPINNLAQAAAESVKMVLTGEGADEILAGYPKHAAERHAALYHALVPAALHRRLVAPLVGALPYRFRRVKTAVAAMGERSAETRMPQWFGAFEPATRARLMTIPPGEPPDRAPFEVGRGIGPLGRILYFDQTSWLPDNLLERGDRMTMAASIEARMPFMDVELAALAAALGDRWRIRGYRRKHLLREALSDVVPREILDRPKIGFRLPVNEWFRGPLRPLVGDLLLTPSARINAFLDGDVVREVVEDCLRGRHNLEKHLWTLLSLETFLRECMS